MEKIYSMHKLVRLQLFWSGTPTFSSGTPTFCQMGVLNSCFQNPSESSGSNKIATVQAAYILLHCYVTIIAAFNRCLEKTIDQTISCTAQTHNK